MEGIIHYQLEVHRRISRTMEDLKNLGAEKTDATVVRSCIAALDKRWASFEAKHEELMTSYWKEIAHEEYEKADVFSTVEATYLHQKSLLEAKLAMLAGRDDPTSPDTAKNQSVNPPKPSVNTLPSIRLPEFSGGYEAWPSFRDTFSTLISQDHSLTSFQRLHYLKSCVTGEAESLNDDERQFRASLEDFNHQLREQAVTCTLVPPEVPFVASYEGGDGCRLDRVVCLLQRHQRSLGQHWTRRAQK